LEGEGYEETLRGHFWADPGTPRGSAAGKSVGVKRDPAGWGLCPQGKGEGDIGVMPGEGKRGKGKSAWGAS